MDAVNNSSSSYGSRLFSVILIIIGLVGLYYLYKYLFGSQGTTSYTLNGKSIPANPDTTGKPPSVASDLLPALYEGGEFTISTWIYINNWNYRRGYNKPILSIGGSNFDTIRIYLDANKPKLMIRLNTQEVQGSRKTGELLSNVVAQKGAVFKNLQTGSGLLDTPSPLCDLSEVELQRWVNITVAVNGKTVDVYVDGKLSRSCVLPNMFKVDNNYTAKLLEYGGFGGLLSTTTLYDTALNPDIVYKNYMAGPEPITSIGEWFKSFFA
jgi:hypothetical protein